MSQGETHNKDNDSPQANIYNRDAFWDAIVLLYQGLNTERIITFKYNISSQLAREAISALREHREDLLGRNQSTLQETSNHLQVFRWAKNFAKDKTWENIRQQGAKRRCLYPNHQPIFTF